MRTPWELFQTWASRTIQQVSPASWEGRGGFSGHPSGLGRAGRPLWRRKDTYLVPGRLSLRPGAPPVEAQVIHKALPFSASFPPFLLPASLLFFLVKYEDLQVALGDIDTNMKVRG